jgi:hypothetical protein
MLSLSLCNVWGLFEYTLSFRFSHRLKSREFKSGELVGHNQRLTGLSWNISFERRVISSSVCSSITLHKIAYFFFRKALKKAEKCH